MKHRLVTFTETFPNNEGEDDQLPIASNESRETVSKQLGEEEEDKAAPEKPRYPRRNRAPPRYLDDYDQSENNDSINHIDFCYLIDAPLTYSSAMDSNDSPQWKAAMDEQMESLQSNNTYTLTDPPTGKQIVGGKWVFNVKGNSEQPTYKARYVAIGYSQIQGVDYTETFSPTARMETVRTLMQIAADEDLILHQMDVKSAYLHAPIDEEVYVTQPPGYEVEGKVWKLNKSLLPETEWA